MSCFRSLGWSVVVGGLVLLAPHVWPVSQGQPPAPSGRPSAPPVPHLAAAPTMFWTYCVGCHTSGRAKVDLDGPTDRHGLWQDRSVWERALRALQDGKMPPRRHPQPTPEERSVLITWLAGELAGLEADRESPYLARRVTRREYSNTVRDVLGVAWQPDESFPADETGWDPVRDLPIVPAALLPRYEAAADQVLATTLPAEFVSGAGLTPLPVLSTDLQALPREVWDRDAYVLDWLTAVCQRLWRHEPTVEAMDTVFTTYRLASGDGEEPELGVRAALREVLTSPAFLYHFERRAAAGKDAACTEVELASRLASLLWGSVPDDELLGLARVGRLRADLERQTLRLLGDPRARNFGADFAGAWLGLHKLDTAGHVAAPLRAAMRRETELFADRVFGEDRNLLELLDGDYTFLNEELAGHYGVGGVQGESMRLVPLTGAIRGGVVTQGSVLSVTSREIAPSPVRRGKWVLETLLGTPPPAPPAGLLEAFEQTQKAFGPGSAREHLALHRENASCAHCHARIDGLGLALEGFDGAGAWHPDQHNPGGTAVPLSPEDELRTPADLRAYLLNRREDFLRALAANMLRLGLNRKLTDDDQTALAAVARRLLPEPRFRNLAVELVQSRPFQAALRAP